MAERTASQLDERARLDLLATERAFAELAASVSNPRQAPHIDVRDVEQVDGSVKACLKYLRVEAGDVPVSITDANERIDWLCRPSGTMYRTVRLDKRWYRQAFDPMVGRLDTGETVALLPRGVSGYRYIKPGSGRSVNVDARTSEHIEEEAIAFLKPLPPRSLTVRDLATFIVSSFHLGDYLLVLAAALATTCMGLFLAWANYIAFDIVVPSGQASLIAPIGALLAGIAILTALIGACRPLVMARVSTKLSVACQAATYARVLSLPASFFKHYASGDLASRVSNLNLVTQTTASMSLGVGLTFALSLVCIIQIATFAPVLVVPSLTIICVQAGLTAVSCVLTSRFERETMEASSKLSGTVTALLSGVRKLKLAGAEERAFARWAQGYAPYARAAYNRPVLVVALPALVAIVGFVGTIATYYLAGTHRLSVADYMSYTVAFGQTTASIMVLAQVAGQFAQIRPMLELVGPIMEAEPELAEDKPSVDGLTGRIEVANLSFRYTQDCPYVVKDLSFTVEPQEYVAIVGKSGCGKSTIMRLMLGFEKPESGSVFFGPYDVQKVNVKSLRQHIGTVMQDGKLFMGDIASNITISVPQATIDDAWAAAEVAGIADDIRRMPMGMQTMVSEGSGGVSGGQRQRIIIARAICGNRKVLMFDEATSALDNKTQKHVSDSLAALKCTRIVIAHRLSTVKECDRILVVDGGRIAEEGTYDELLDKGGLFAELVARQRLDA